MAVRSGSPQEVVKTEVQSDRVIFTYFQGDIGSMVDQHFTRALGKVGKNKAPSGKGKKSRKAVKSESDLTSCRWGVSTPSWSEGHFAPVSGSLQLSNTKESSSSHPPALDSPDESPSPWAFASRQHGGLGLPAMAYPHAMSPEGLGVTGQHYTNSLLNLLHSDRSEVAADMVSGSKPELFPSWTGHPVFREPMNPDSGIVLEKKDLYWY
uniref:transcription cofactor vestigial-like protein 2 n=1 Tax=Oncorhynchus gorbuscha TaxID=8017 RepID=UPI001EAF85D0|nr:transcription cofactor vestigial-like protein 2 [Oncorhynchus gorbuscha]XP_046180736.1 transcription cofactor vestigial-like protein 2 [Oncorhynchus gorbuscha]